MRNAGLPHPYARDQRVLAATLSSAEAAAGRSLLDLALAEESGPSASCVQLAVESGTSFMLFPPVSSWKSCVVTGVWLEETRPMSC
jgi:hypothetical protein